MSFEVALEGRVLCSLLALTREVVPVEKSVLGGSANVLLAPSVGSCVAICPIIAVTAGETGEADQAQQPEPTPVVVIIPVGGLFGCGTASVGWLGRSRLILGER